MNWSSKKHQKLALLVAATGMSLRHVQTIDLTGLDYSERYVGRKTRRECIKGIRFHAGAKPNLRRFAIKPDLPLCNQNIPLEDTTTFLPSNKKLCEKSVASAIEITSEGHVAPPLKQWRS